MGLKKTAQTQYGVEVSYWRVSQSSCDYDRHFTNLTLEAYPDKGTREIEPKPQPIQTVNLIIQQIDLKRSDIYAFLKGNKINGPFAELDFTDAIDD